MSLNQLIPVLDELYSVYESFSAGLETVCGPGCADCCTINVALTTLEGVKIVQYLNANGRFDLIDEVRRVLPRKRFTPPATTNQIAVLCMEGHDVPESENNPDWGPCPFLESNLCAVYPVRPFACRSMSSRRKCAETGYAQMDDFTFTVNDIFYQCVEHADRKGGYGNLSDIVTALIDSADTGLRVESPGNNMIPNYPARIWMIPPEHRTRIQPLLNSLRPLMMSLDHV